MNDQYIELKPGMEVLITDPSYGFVDKHVVIGEVKLFYSCWSGYFDSELTCTSDGKEYKICYSQPTNVKVKLCRRVYVKDLCVGDVIERDNQRGFVKSNYDDEVGVIWFNTVDTHCYITSYCNEIEDAELVGHIDLWNL